MNGRKAKAARRAIYGTDFSPRERKYRARITKKKNEKGQIIDRVTRLSGWKRRAYQLIKRQGKLKKKVSQ